MHRHAVVGQRAGAPAGCVIFTAGEAVGRRVARIAEAEVGRGEGVGGVFERGDRVVGARRRVVDRGDVDGDRVGRRVEVDAAVGGAAVVLHLEGEARVAGAVGVGRRGELEQPAGDVGQRRSNWPARHRHAVVGAACRRPAGW